MFRHMTSKQCNFEALSKPAGVANFVLQSEVSFSQVWPLDVNHLSNHLSCIVFCNGKSHIHASVQKQVHTLFESKDGTNGTTMPNNIPFIHMYV